MADAFPIGGSIDPASFPFLLANLHQQGATGSLKVDGPTAQKALYFRGGRILFGSSNDPRDQLGAILIESGRLSAEQLDVASAKVGPGNPLAKVLADSGLVSQRDLSEAAKAKVERILSDLFAMTEGSFEFEDDVLPKGAIDLKLATPRLIVAALRRLDERAFVERHLGGLGAVLQPASDSASRLAEIFTETAGLPDLLDGRRTLHEAAAMAQLDPFEAARLACALLFLGLVEKVRAAAPEAFQAIESEADELDLAQTARLSFDFTPAPTPAASSAPPAGGDGELPFFLPSDAVASVPPPVFQPLSPTAFAPEPEPEPVPEPAPTLRLPPLEAPAPTFIVPPPAPVPAAAPPAPAVTAPTPPEPPSPPPVVTPSRATPARSGSSHLPLIPPPPRVPRASRPPAARGEDAEPTLGPPPVAPRPSKEDLEALDSLLNTRSLEAPLAGSTTSEQPAAAAPRRLPAWEPSFGRGTPGRGRTPAARGRAATRGRPRVGWVVLAVLVLLVGAGGGWYWYGSRTTAVPPKAVVKPHPLTPATPTTWPSPIAVGTAPPPVQLPPGAEDDEDEVPAPQPTPVTARAGIAPPAASAPPASAAPSRATPPPPARASSVDDARASLRRGDLVAAGRGFAGTLRAAPRETYSLQLLLACAPETVTKAVAGADAPELFVVPIHYRGRDCYRVCWGLYDGRARAESARASLPPYFRTGGVTPKVVAAADLLR